MIALKRKPFVWYLVKANDFAKILRKIPGIFLLTPEGMLGFYQGGNVQRAFSWETRS